MESKKNIAPKVKRKKYEINTGQIFLGLSDSDERNWENYDRKFLITAVEKKIQKALIEKNICTVKFNDQTKGYLESYVVNRYPMELKNAMDENNFPFPDYFLKPGNKSNSPALVAYEEPCIIDREDNSFDLFFALQFSLTNIVDGDILEADEFLKFHLAHSFIGDLKKYKIFLDRICLKYSEFLKEKYEPLVEQFLKKLEHSNLGSKKLKQQPESVIKPKLNWNGNNNSICYLFRQLKNFTNEKGLPLIPNTYDEIASFLKENISEFKNMEHSTILRLLNTDEKPKKATKKIEIYI